jgi:metal-sulfur cluster biosynthetic enzyme
MPDISLDGDTPRPNVYQEPPRPFHDRELPVSASEADRPQAHRSSEPVDSRSDDDAAATTTPEAASSAPSDGAEEITEDLVKLALRRVKDPELNLNILDLGLVYDIRVDGSAVSIDMTLTSPGCPSGPEIMTDAERHLKAIPGVGAVAVNLVWSPFWSPDRIEPRVRAYLGF